MKKVKSHEESKKNKGISRRKFLAGGMAAGALALGGVLGGNKDILAQSLAKIGGSRWEITIDGKLFKEGYVPMNSTEELQVPVQNGTARIVFDHGRIYMPEDNNVCGKKICSLMGSITKSGEKITCLPNKLVVRIL